MLVLELGASGAGGGGDWCRKHRWPVTCVPKLAAVLQHTPGGLVAVAQTGQGLFSCTNRATNSPHNDTRLAFSLLPYTRTAVDYQVHIILTERVHRLW